MASGEGVQYLSKSIIWDRSSDELRPYMANVDCHPWVIRLNDFPEEKLYTLIVDDVEVVSFDDWPNAWTRPV